MEITTIVVHPAYWHQGNGTKLARWCMELASMDHTGIGVSATPMGKGLFEHIGFIEKQVVEVKGYEGHRGSIKLWIGIYDRGVERLMVTALHRPAVPAEAMKKIAHSATI